MNFMNKANLSFVSLEISSTWIVKVQGQNEIKKEKRMNSYFLAFGFDSVLKKLLFDALHVNV